MVGEIFHNTMRFQVLGFLLLLPTLLCASAVDQMVFPNQAEDPFTKSEPTLADLLTIEPSASIFFSYARELRLGNMLNEKGPRITVLVPTNKAVQALARKPHQGPVPVDEGIVITQEEFETRSKQNVLRWISAHIIPTSPVEFDSKTYETLLDGKSVGFEVLDSGETDAPEWSRVQIDKDMRIIGSKEACNGVYYLIDGTVQVD